MNHKVLTKLVEELNLPIESERQVTHIMILIRKAIEEDKLEETFENLQLMCNWVAHINLTNKTVKKQIAFLNDIDAAELSGPSKELAEQFSKVFSLHAFRVELLNFIRHFRLNERLKHVFTPEWWVGFLKLYIEVVMSSPLILTGKDIAVKNVNKIHIGGYGWDESDDPRFSIIFVMYWNIHYHDDTLVIIPVPLGIEKDTGFRFGRAGRNASLQQGPPPPPAKD